MMPKTLSALAGLLLASCSPPGPSPHDPSTTPVPGAASPATPDPAPPDSASPDGPRGPARVLMDGDANIEALERLFAATPQNAAERPSLMRRLAEAYVQLETSAHGDQLEHTMRRDAARKAADAGREQVEASAEAKASKVVEGARRKAITYYSMLAREYPRWCAPAGGDTGCIDEVLYYLAFEHEAAREPEEAQKVYRELIKSFPQSRFIPNAYLALAEAFFNEATSDPQKLPLAEQAYAAVLRYPPPSNKVAGYAHYKLGYVYWNRGDLARALGEMTKAIEVSDNHPAPSGAQLARSARNDLPAIYAAAGDPGKAYDFLARWSGDPPGQSAGLHRMLDKLAESYSDTGKPDALVALSLDWLRHGAGAKTCDLVARIDAAVKDARPNDRAALQATTAASAPLRAARAQCAP